MYDFSQPVEFLREVLEKYEIAKINEELRIG